MSFVLFFSILIHHDDTLAPHNKIVNVNLPHQWVSGFTNQIVKIAKTEKLRD